MLISICALPDLHSSVRKVKRDIVRRKTSILERLIRRSPSAPTPQQSKSVVVRPSRTPTWRWSLPALFALGSVASASSVKFPASLQLKTGIISLPEVSAWSWFPATLSAPALDVKGYVAKLSSSLVDLESISLFERPIWSRWLPVVSVGELMPGSLSFGVKPLVAGYFATASKALAVARGDALAWCFDSWSKIRLPASLLAACHSVSLPRFITSWSRPDMLIVAMSGGLGLAILASLTIVRRSLINKRQQISDTSPPSRLRSSTRGSKRSSTTSAAKKRPPRKAKKEKPLAETTPPPPANLLSNPSGGRTWPRMFAAPITGE